MGRGYGHGKHHCECDSDHTLTFVTAIEGGDQEKIEDDAEVVNGTSEIDAEKKSENLQEIRNRVVLVNGKTVDIEPKGKKKSGSLFGGNFGVLGYQV